MLEFIYFYDDHEAVTGSTCKWLSYEEVSGLYPDRTDEIGNYQGIRFISARADLGDCVFELSEVDHLDGWRHAFILPPVLNHIPKKVHCDYLARGPPSLCWW